MSKVKEFRLSRGKGKLKGKIMLKVIYENETDNFTMVCCNWKQAYMMMDCDHEL